MWTRNLSKLVVVVASQTGMADKYFQRLLETGTYSDFIIQTGDQAFQVHRAILHGKSPFLNALIGGDFKVRARDSSSNHPDSHQESSQQEASLPEIEPAIVAGALKWIYTGIHPIPYSETKVISTSFEMASRPIHNDQITLACTTANTSHKSEVLSSWDSISHIKLFIAADNWMLPDLQNAACQNLRALIADHNANILRADPDFHKAIAMVYEGYASFEELKVLVAYATTLVVDRDHDSWHSWAGLGSQIGEFGWYLFMEHERNIQKRYCLYCGLIQVSKHEDYPQFYVCTLEDTFIWLKCTCDLRGLCSSTCKLFDTTSRQPVAYCNDCVLCTDVDRKCELTRGEDGKLRFR